MQRPVVHSSPGPSVPAPVWQTSQHPDHLQRQRYKLWVDPVLEVLSPILEDRGRQLGNVVCFAGCAGLVTEHKPLELLGIKTEFEYVADPEAYSFQWRRANGPVCKHHFRDMVDVGRYGKGFCYEHGCVCEATIPQDVAHKKFTCGTSCKPFSTARAHRISEGTMQHKDRNLWDAFLNELLRIDADEAWLENVMGIVMRESKEVAKSPLQSMIEEASEKAPQYAIRVFFMPGNTFLPLSRRRVFVHMLHNRRGGAAAQDRMVGYLKAN